jgi:hypothetical protein
MEEKEFKQQIVDRYPPEELQRVAEQMRKAIEVRDRRYHFKNYESCFLGSDLVNWFIENGHASTVEEAIEVGDYFMSKNVFHHVVRDHTFKNQKLYYRFEIDEKNRGH